MTVMERKTQARRAPPLVCWPRGAVLFGTNRRAAAAAAAPDAAEAVRLARHCVVYHLHQQRARPVAWPDWRRIAGLKMGLAADAAFLLFVQAQQVSRLPRQVRLRSAADPADSADVPRCDLLGLAVALLLVGCAPPRPDAQRDVVRFLKDNMEPILDCLLLCSYELANKHIKSARLEQLTRLEKVPVTALANLDALFEGTLRTSGSPADVVPMALSQLIAASLGLGEEDQLSFDDLVQLMHKSLQPDMFGLDESSVTASARPSAAAAARTLTATQLAEHRKLTLRRWTHAELLTKSVYQGANLRVCTAQPGGSVLMCPRFMRSAHIMNVQSSGPIVLGPVSGFVILENLQDVQVSVVCDRILVQNCHDVTLFLNAKTAPIVGRSCSRVLLGPYNAFYDGLQSELEHAGMQLLPIKDNQFADPVQLNSILAPEPGQTYLSAWDILDPSRFYIQPTPFPADKSTKFYQHFLDSIPSIYLDSFRDRLRYAECWLERNPQHRLIGVPEADRTYLEKRLRSH